jgi:hypothetical protein
MFSQEEIYVLPRIDIGFVKRENFSQEGILVLLIKKSLVKKRYKFCQERKI